MKKTCSVDDQFLLMNGEMHEDFLSEIIFISLQNFAFLLVISLRKKSICRQRRISLRLFNFLLIEENYIHLSSELSSSKNFSFTLLGLTISAQLGTISLFSREMVQPSPLLDMITLSIRLDIELILEGVFNDTDDSSKVFRVSLSFAKFEVELDKFTLPSTITI